MMEAKKLHPSQLVPFGGGFVPRAFSRQTFDVNGIPMLVNWHVTPTGARKPYLTDSNGETYTLWTTETPSKLIVLNAAQQYVGHVLAFGDYLEEWTDTPT